MRPFNLAEALDGKPVVDGLGRKITQFHRYSLGGPYPVAAVANDVEIVTFTTDGRYLCNDSAHSNNLYMFEEPVVEMAQRHGCVNVWRNDPFGPLHATVHGSLEQALAERPASITGKKRVLIARREF
jgi:hypothetical protein